jgi:Phosphorylated adapter RNA export protein, RNA-binding domain
MARNERTSEQQETAPSGPATFGEVVQTIAEQLDETEAEPLRLLRRVVKRLGTEEALAFLHKTLEAEAQGGLTLADGSRRRTLGGTFFFLVRTQGSGRVRSAFWQPRKYAETGATSSPSETQTSFSWADHLAVLDEIDEKGTISTVSITLLEHPGKVVDRGACVVTNMGSSKVPSLPKDLPTSSSHVMKYTVYIAMQQWREISDAIRNADDVLILERFPYFDAKSSSIAVFVTSAAQTEKLAS